MNYLKYTQYVYILIAVAFIYDGITKLNDPATSPWLSFLCFFSSSVKSTYLDT
ncbi:hypothetical protein AB9T88_02005 [Flavobacterium sp. LBUM151]